MQPRVERAIRSEEAFGLATFGQLMERPDVVGLLEGTEKQEWSPMGTALFRAFFLAEDLRSYRRFMGHQARLCSRPHKEVVTTESPRPTGILTAMLVPAVRNVHNAAARTDAQTKLTHVGLALYRDRLKHGTFCDNLEQLAERSELIVPIDPYNGEPFKFRRADDEVMIYSVGPNMKDDQGEPIDYSTREGDLTFTVRSSSDD